MSRGLKTFVAVAVASLLFGIIVAAIGARWLGSNKDRLAEGMKEILDEGVRYAAGRDERACVDEGFARGDRCGRFDWKCHLKVPFFLRACLRAATPTPGFCQEVPPPSSLSSWGYRLSTCARLGRVDSEGCSLILTEVQLHCEAELDP